MSIKCEGVNISFRQEVLDSEGSKMLFKENVDFELPERSVSLIFGPAGSGKTTLFNILAGIVTPDVGKVYWDNYELESFEKANKKRHKFISMAFSMFYFLDGLNVEENIVLPAAFVKKENKFIKEKLNCFYDELFNFGDHPEMKFLNLNAFRKRKVKTLSNGQKEIVALARALVLDTKYVFADELFRSFNENAEKNIWENFIKYLQGNKMALLLITHKHHMMNWAGISGMYFIKDSIFSEYNHFEIGGDK